MRSGNSKQVLLDAVEFGLNELYPEEQNLKPFAFVEKGAGRRKRKA